MVDLARIRQKAADIRGAVDALSKLAAHSEVEFVRDRMVTAAAKYELIVAIEASIDLCNYFCSRRMSKAPANYADCFRLLAEGGVISEAAALRLMPMARFRNLLVHQYGEIDNARVHRIIRENLVDLESFLTELGGYLGQEI